jgi:hypothetical protein
LRAARTVDAALLTYCRSRYRGERPSRFDRKAFLKLTLKKAYTILAHLGALRLPTHLKLYPATSAPAEEDLPFDPVWLTTVGLVSASWHTNILASSGTALSLSKFLITHRLARARPCLPGAFYPDIDPASLRSPTVLKALRTGTFASGRYLPTDQWQTALTPYHFIVSVPGQTAMPVPASRRFFGVADGHPRFENGLVVPSHLQ